MNLEILLMTCLLIIKCIHPFQFTHLPASLLSFQQEPLIEGLEFRIMEFDSTSKLFVEIVPVLLLNVLAF